MERIAMDFEQEFKVLYRPLCLFALQYIPRTEDAEDIVQHNSVQNNFAIK